MDDARGFRAVQCHGGDGDWCYRVWHFPSDGVGILVGGFDGAERESLPDMLIRVAEWAYQRGKEAAGD